MRVRKHERRTSEVRCVLCHDHIPSGGVTCPTCDVRFHRACHEGKNGCPTYGCEGQIEDLVLPSSSSSFELVRTLIGAAVLLVPLALVAAAAVGVYLMYAEREEEARGRAALEKYHAEEAAEAARQRATRQRLADQERALAEREAFEAQQEARRAAEKALLERRAREAAAQQAELRADQAAVEEKRRQNELERDQRQRLRALEQGAAEWVRTVVFGELAAGRGMKTEHPLDARAQGLLRAGQWLNAEVVAATARFDGVIEVRVRAPGIATEAPCLFEARHRPETGWSLVQVR